MTVVPPDAIMACIQRQNGREAKALDRAMFDCGSHRLPRIETRKAIRRWYRERWEYLMHEHDKALVAQRILPRR